MRNWNMVLLLELVQLGRWGKKAVARSLQARLTEFLSVFTKDPVTFCDEIRKNAAVLSGDCALAFLK